MPLFTSLFKCLSALGRRMLHRTSSRQNKVKITDSDLKWSAVFNRDDFDKNEKKKKRCGKSLIDFYRTSFIDFCQNLTKNVPMRAKLCLCSLSKLRFTEHRCSRNLQILYAISSRFYTNPSSTKSLSKGRFSVSWFSWNRACSTAFCRECLLKMKHKQRRRKRDDIFSQY